MICVILQPSYIPWRGYFHQIQRADIFVFYDDVKFDKNGWRNRNRIKTATGSQWLTIPVHTQNLETEQTPINKITIDWSTKWNRKHWHALRTNYARAPFFDQYAPQIQPFYEQQPELLADLTIEMTIAIARMIGIAHTQFLRSSDLQGITGRKTERLIQILTRLGATHYISGPAAKNYIDEEQFKQAGIQLEFMTYSYPEYTQLYPPFDPQVSILDLIFMTGPDALKYIVTPT